MLSAYAFMLGLYPNSVKNPKLRDESLPVPHEKLETLRTDLNLEKIPSNGIDALIQTQKDDYALPSSIVTTCGGIVPLVKEQLLEVQPEFDNLYGNRLYDDMAKTLKIPRSELRFTTAYKWLDEYVCAKAEGKTPKRGWRHPDETVASLRRY